MVSSWQAHNATQLNNTLSPSSQVGKAMQTCVYILNAFAFGKNI